MTVPQTGHVCTCGMKALHPEGLVRLVHVCLLTSRVWTQLQRNLSCSAMLVGLKIETSTLCACYCTLFQTLNTHSKRYTTSSWSLAIPISLTIETLAMLSFLGRRNFYPRGLGTCCQRCSTEKSIPRQENGVKQLCVFGTPERPGRKMAAELNAYISFTLKRRLQPISKPHKAIEGLFYLVHD